MAETPTPQPQMDPWRFMALVAQCATQAQIDVERAFRFMSLMQVGLQGAAPPAPPAAPPRPSSTVQ